MPGLVKTPTKMSQVATTSHQAPGVSQANTTNGPPQTSQGPPGDYIGTSPPDRRRVTIVGGGGLHHHHHHRTSMVDRQNSFSSGSHEASEIFGSRSSMEDHLLTPHRGRDSRGDVDSTTAVLDAAILDLTRRRLAM